jgi:hypothetical protein
VEIDLKALKEVIAGKFEDYLGGKVSQYDLIGWAAELENKVECLDSPSSPHTIDYFVVEDALWAILLLNHDPEEFATRPEELKLSLSYLTGEILFSMEKVPTGNFEGLSSTSSEMNRDCGGG